MVRALRLGAAEMDGAEAEVLEAASVAEARAALQSEEFACIFLDHYLPDGTSLDLLLEVRAQGLATPVVVLTGQRDERTVLEVMKAGAAEFVPKERLQPDLVARSLRAALRFMSVQREKQAALDALRARDRAIASATNGVAIADPRLPDSPLVYVNEAFLQMTGYTEEEVVGRNCRFLQGPDTDPETIRQLRDAVRGAYPCQVAILNQRKDGTPFWNELTVSPVRDEQGTLTHFVGIQTDVTARFEQDEERTRVENRLRQFQFLSDNASDAYFLIDEDGRFVYVNDAACHSLGYAAADFQGMRAFDIDPNYDDASYRALFRRAADERLPPFDSVQRRADGTLFPIEASVSRLDIGGRPLLFSICRDISDRKALEAERAQITEREHRIAEQLQAALQPDLPDRVPGLAIAKYYEPALTDEAEVGGDFYDVFPISADCTALVLGDLSGKGLQAAAQVSIVRNMLRAFLYSLPTVSAAATELNRVLTENTLLTGFSTLFFGVYSRGERILNYVNCGQEPGLIRRAADGRVEQLPPTGPILGGIEGVQYEQGYAVLAPGDALAVFSDGMTEIGPSRRAMLGIDGVAALLEGALTEKTQMEKTQTAAETAEKLALHLIAGVDAAAAAGVMRDDICLLVAVVED